jgi:cell division septal protein FtsQ
MGAASKQAGSGPPAEAAASVRPARERRVSDVAARVAPSWRSIATGVLLIVAAAGAYLLARETSVFAVRTIEVGGATPDVAAEVRAALAPLRGRSLLKVDGGDIDTRLARLSSVAASSYDRAFPHTLRVYVRLEEPLAIVREGADAWLVARDGRIVRKLAHPRLSSLPRIWLPRTTSVGVGATLADDQGRRALAALAPLRGTTVATLVRDVRTSDSELTLVLRSGLEIRLGDARNLRLKLAVARRIMPLLTPPAYLDVSVPSRAVAGNDLQLAG